MSILLARDGARDRAAEALAVQQGWTLRDERDTHTRLGGWPLGVGHDRTSHRTLTGTHRGGAVLAFDFSYRLTDRVIDKLLMPRQKWTVAALTNPRDAYLPGLLVAPQGKVGEILTRATNLDIELESEDFNRAFLVGGPDRRFAFDFLSPPVMQLMLGWRELGWRTIGPRLVAFRKGWGDVPDLVPMLDLAADIIDLVPEFVWAARREDHL